MNVDDSLEKDRKVWISGDVEHHHSAADQHHQAGDQPLDKHLELGLEKQQILSDQWQSCTLRGIKN